MLWAAKRCNYYVVNLLLEHGADPLLTDDQGFNLLHSATLDGNVYQLVLLLHQDIPVDIPDPQSHTPLMWAAYKGYPSCVDLFLRWGANVYATDDQGFTALHWALVKGSQGSIQKLLEYGADRFAKNNDGKTPAVTAEEMNTTRQWRRALSEAGYKPDGSPKEFPVPAVKDTRWFLSRFTFFWPFLIIVFGLWLVSYYPVFIGLPLALISSYAMQMAVQKLLQWGPSNMRSIHHSVSATNGLGKQKLTASSPSWLVSLQALCFGSECGTSQPSFQVNTVYSQASNTSNLLRNDPRLLLHEYSLCSILQPRRLLLLLHHVLRPRLRAQVRQPKRVQSPHRRTDGVAPVR